MKAFKNTVILISIIIIAGCIRNSDVLATYEGGEITRGELYSKLEEQNLPAGNFKQRKIYQKKELKMIAVDKISIIEAKKNKYHESQRFNFLYNDVKKKYLGAYLIDELFKEKGYKEKVINISHIVLKLKDRSKNEEKRAIDLAEKIIDKLKSGESFEKLAAIYSEDISKTRSGKMGYMIYDMLPEKYARAVFSLSKGEFTEKPVLYNKRKRIYIAKANDIQYLTSGNIEEIITDDKMRENYIKLIKRKTKDKYIDEIKKDLNSSYYDALIFSKHKQEVLFQIDGKDYTIARLNDRMNNIKSTSSRTRTNDSNYLRKRIAGEFFLSEILNYAAQKRGIHKNRDFIQKMKGIYDSYLAGDFMEYINSREIEITEDEMRREYNTNKLSRYFKVQKQGNEQKKIAKAYNSVKVEIIESIKEMKTLKSKARWIDDILKKYNYRINESELEGI